MSAPTPDKAEILRALSILFDKDDVVEMRIIRKNKQIDAGYFDYAHRESMAAIAEANNRNAQIYVVMNQIDPQLHSRYHNRLEQYAKDTCNDANIIKRKWLLIDCDPKRPAGTSATDNQLQEAIILSEKIFQDLSTKGFPDPVVCMSGNGSHLLYKLDIENNPENTKLIKEFLIYLSKTYDNDHVSIDKSVFNAARITKLYGTIATKGDHTKTAAHRLSHIVSVPDDIQILSPELIRSCLPVEEEPAPKQSQSYSGTSTSSFNIYDFLNRAGVGYKESSYNGGTKFVLEHCLFNHEHQAPDAVIIQLANGALVYKCLHNSCSDKHWKDARVFVDGERPKCKRYTMQSLNNSEVSEIDIPDLLTDQRVKNYFAGCYNELVQYVPGIGWHYWTQQRWVTDQPGGLHPFIDQMQQFLMSEAQKIEDEDARIKRRKSLLGLEMHAKQLTLISACQTVPSLITEANNLDRDTMFFNCLNGTLDLRTGILQFYNPDHLITRISNIEYDPNAECPQFIKFITWAMQDNEELVAYLQRWIGYCLTGDTSEQKLNYWYGTGSNGKTTLMNVVQELLCDYSTTADTALIMKRDNGSDTNRYSMLASLRGARAVILSEVNDGEKLDEAAIKSFTGGDTVNACFKYEKFFSYKPTGKLIAFGNYKPSIRGTDYGIWRRFDLVPFKATISETEKDADLPAKLRAEMSGILAWAVRGCLDWQRIGLSAPEAIRKATDEYRKSEDVFSTWLSEYCTVAPDRKELSSILLESFKEFSGWRGMSQKKFGSLLTDHGFESRKSNGKYFWEGLDLQISADSADRPPFSGKSHREVVLKSLPENPLNGHYQHFLDDQGEITLTEEDLSW